MTTSQTIADLDAGIDSAIAQHRIVGCGVILAEGGRRVMERFAGHADREAAVPMHPEIWLRYASVSKPFTTMAALRLMAQGKLGAEHPVARYLPDFTPALADGSRPEITVNHLMSHMAGLDYTFSHAPDGAYPRAGISDGIGDTGISLAENLRRITAVPLDIRPGTAWRYSIATDVLGAVIEAAADMDLPKAMTQLVTEPLEIEAAFRAAETATLATNYADGPVEPRRMRGLTHVPIPARPDRVYTFLPDRARDPAAYPSGGGGMSGTVGAALTLLETFRTGNFIPDTLRRAATANRITGPHPMRGPGWGHSWAGAVLVDPALAGISLSAGSLGWGGIYGHSWIIEPQKNRSLVAMTNTSTQGVNGAFAVEMAVALMG